MFDQQNQVIPFLPFGSSFSVILDPNSMASGTTNMAALPPPSSSPVSVASSSSSSMSRAGSNAERAHVMADPDHVCEVSIRRVGENDLTGIVGLFQVSCHFI